MIIFKWTFMNLDHYSALARLINLLRRAGKLDDCSKYLEQVSFSVILVLRSMSKLIFPPLFLSFKSKDICGI